MRLTKFYVIVLVLLISLVIAGCTTSNQTVTKIFKNIAVSEAAELIEENENNPYFKILDVRTPAEYDTGYIKDAINIDYYSDSFQDELNKFDKTDTYFIYCRTGNRSGKTMEIMKSLGFTNVYNLSGGGMGDWIASGLPYEVTNGAN